MKILKRTGLRNDPCGTLVLTLYHKLKEETIFILCFLLVTHVVSNHMLYTNT